MLAQVIKVDLELSRTNIEFIFKDTNSKMYTEETVTMENKYNANAYFSFEIPEDCVFKVTP